jgi:hypothetical protein
MQARQRTGGYDHDLLGMVGKLGDLLADNLNQGLGLDCGCHLLRVERAIHGQRMPRRDAAAGGRAHRQRSHPAHLLLE